MGREFAAEKRNEDVSPAYLPLGERETRQALRLSLWDGFFAAMSENGGIPFITPFAVAMGASSPQIGLLIAFSSFLGNIMQLPLAWVAEHFRIRKALSFFTSLGARLLWVPIGLLPFFFSSRSVAITWLIVLYALRLILVNAGIPAWTSLIADIVSKDRRGDFFGVRNALASSGSLLALLLATGILAKIEFPVGYLAVFALACASGLISLWYYGRMPEPRRAPAPEGNERGRKSERAREKRACPSLRRRWQTLKGRLFFTPNYGWYCVTAVLWNFGIFLGGPLIPVFLLQNLHAPAYFIGWNTMVNILAAVLTQRFWGRMSVRYGEKWVMLTGGMGIVLIPFFYLLLPSYPLAILVETMSGSAWGAYNLANFNFILKLVPVEKRATYTAQINTYNAFGLLLGPLLGGYLAAWSNIYLVLALSGLVRLVVWLLFARFVREEERPPRQFQGRWTLRVWRRFLRGSLRSSRRRLQTSLRALAVTLLGLLRG